MKRFMQGCAITALVLIVLGLGMAVIGGSLKGKQAITSVVESATGGRVNVKLNSLSDWGITIGETVNNAIENGLPEGLDEVHYEIEDAMVFNNDYEIFRGNVEKYAVGSEISGLFVEVGGCVFDVKQSEDSNYYLKAENTKKFQSYVEDGKLYIKGTVGTGTVSSVKECRITLYVPENWADNRLEKVDIELGAGLMELNRIAAEKILLEVGAGQITVAEMEADTLDVSVGMGEILVEDLKVEKLLGEVGMGHLYLEGSIADKADMECAVGSLEMVVEGSEKDFNYDVECGMGNIRLDGKNFGGVAQEQIIDNGATKKMLVECAMGDVNISFKK